MKKKLIIRLTVGISSLFLACFLLISIPYLHTSREFKNLSERIFIQELEKDTLSQHYILADTQAYGITSSSARLPLFSEQYYADLQAFTDSTLTNFAAINKNFLNREQSLTYEQIVDFYTDVQKSLAFPYYAEPLSPSSGLQSQLPILFAEYSFHTKEDVSTYISLLEALPAYLNSTLLYEQKKAEKGLLMPDFSLSKVIKQCYSILDFDSLQNDSHFLITSFSQRLSALTSDKKITPAEESSYLSKNKDLLIQKVYPAYRNLGDSLSALKGRGKNQKGLCNYNMGKDYYSYLVQSTSSSSKSIPEIKEVLIAQLSKDYAKLNSMATQWQAQLNAPSLLLPFPENTPEEILTKLQERMKEDYPDFPKTETISHTVKLVSENLQDYVSPAFYLTPPLDRIYDNVIYINPKEQSTPLYLYTTLAHEGYPGHLYQTVYHLMSQSQHNTTLLPNLFSYGGYVEGWAYYVENNSYDYAKDLIPDNSQAPYHRAYIEMTRLSQNIRINTYCLVDIALHYENADFLNISQMLGAIGILDPTSVLAIYQYILEEPAIYLKYYLGYLEILECREEAMRLWKAEYSPMKFHSFILENGPATFTQLRSKLNLFN